MTVLVAREIVYLSQGDEDAFFNWLNGIGCVSQVNGIGLELHISIKSSLVSDIDLRELLALFYRYHVDMKQLARFSSPENFSWFHDKKSFWYGKVFG